MISWAWAWAVHAGGRSAPIGYDQLGLGALTRAHFGAAC